MRPCVTIETADNGVVTGRNGEMPVAIESNVGRVSYNQQGNEFAQRRLKKKTLTSIAKLTELLHAEQAGWMAHQAE